MDNKKIIIIAASALLVIMLLFLLVKQPQDDTSGQLQIVTTESGNQLQVISLGHFALNQELAVHVQRADPGFAIHDGLYRRNDHQEVLPDVADAAGGGVRHMEPVQGFSESGQLHAVSAVLYTPGVHGGQDRLCTHPITWLYLMPHQSPSNTVT